MAALVPLVVLAMAGATAVRGDGNPDPPKLPEALRGTWTLRATSQNAGKEWAPSDGRPIFKIGETTVTFLQPDLGDLAGILQREMTVKEVVEAKGGDGAVRHTLAFAGGQTWTVIREQAGNLVVALRAADPKDPGVTHRYWMKLVK